MVNITEKYKPKSLSEYIGDKAQIEEIKQYLDSHFPVILVSPPGYGKTCFAYAYANDMEYSLIETNASEERRKDKLNELEVKLRTNTFFPTLFLIDEIDSMKEQKTLASILKKVNHPVILTANDKQKLDKTLKKVCKVIELKKPPYGLITNRIKHIAKIENLKFDLTLIGPDIRSTLNKVFNDSDGYNSEVNDFEKVDRIFRHKQFFSIDPIWLIDNVSNYYYGKNLLDAIETIKMYKNYKNVEILKNLPVAYSGRPQFPRFLRGYGGSQTS